MIPIATCAGKTIAVFGLGRSGLATCRALEAGGAQAIAWDDGDAARRAAVEQGFDVRDLRHLDWAHLSALVLAPGVPLTHPEPHWTVRLAQDHGVEIIGDVELFARERRANCPEAPFIAITGTNGKSTTTALISHVLRQAGRDVQMGGNIGVAILELEPPARERVHVIELSSYQIDLMPTLGSSIGVLLNVSPDHLDRHGTFENYAKVKARLPAVADLAVVGRDDEISRDVLRDLRAKGRRALAVSGGPVDDGYGVEAGKVTHYAAGACPRAIADINNVSSLRGTHNAQNAAATTAVCKALGLTDGEIAAGLRTFPGLVHRMEEVGRIGRVILINDSKATNAASTANALAAFAGDIFWIAGGLAKDGGIDDLAQYFPRIAKAYLIGDAAPDFASTLTGRCQFEISGSLDNALRCAVEDATRSSATAPVVLLSPACASFDQFRSFEARGDAFRELAAEIARVEARGTAP